MEVLQKRARAKYITLAYLFDLIDLDSDLQKSYWQTFHCASVLIQKDQKITSKYCNQRWCIVCNRIRTGKLINGYLNNLRAMNDPQFLTLTIKTMRGEELKKAVETMIGEFRSIYFQRKKRNRPFKALRKLESTYNPNTNEFHPHFHLQVESKETAEYILSSWMERFPTNDLKAQWLVPATEGTELELFKYTTKILTNKSFYAGPMDTIFKAFKNKRIYQAYDLPKVSEEVDPETATILTDDVQEQIWTWLNHDWIDTETGECLSQFSPNDTIERLISHIKKHSVTV